MREHEGWAASRGPALADRTRPRRLRLRDACEPLAASPLGGATHNQRRIRRAIAARAQRVVRDDARVRREDGVIVGYFNLSQIIRGPLQSAFLGYGGVAGYSGEGDMTEGMRLVLRRSFVELRLHRVEANIQPANGLSIALARRAGLSARAS